jgi:hypothetical protein
VSAIQPKVSMVLQFRQLRKCCVIEKKCNYFPWPIEKRSPPITLSDSIDKNILSYNYKININTLEAILDHAYLLQKKMQKYEHDVHQFLQQFVRKL